MTKSQVPTDPTRANPRRGRTAVPVAACLALFLLIMSPPSGAAQQVDLGLRAGGGIANIGGDSFGDENLGAAGAYAYGLFAAYHLSTSLAVQAEILWTGKGTSFTTDPEVLDPSQIYDYGVTLQYMEIPVLAKFTPGRAAGGGRTAVTSFYAGPSLAFLRSATGWDSRLDDDVELADDVSGFDLGLVLGLSAAWSAGPGAITLDLRYNQGLLDVDRSDDLSGRNLNFLFMLGYSMSMGL